MVTASKTPKIGVGVDPEFFVIDLEANRFCSAHELVPGTKEKPHALDKGAVQVDGCAIEYNTSPAFSAIEFAQNNTEVIKQIRAMVPEKYQFVYDPVVYFDRYYFDKVVPASPKELGCSPDFNAYTGKMNPRPMPAASKYTMRTASGHIHISWTEGANVDDPSHRYDCELVVRALECCLIPWIKFFDKDKERSELYGKPGALRYKSYGVEWRYPSNAWLNHPEIWEWLFDSVVKIVTALFEGKLTPPKEPNKFAGIHGVFYSMTHYLGTNITRRTLESTMKSYAPFLDPMPVLEVEKKAEEEKKEAKKQTKAGRDGFQYKRISPTSSSIKWDINLDIPQDDSIPLPAYLAEATVHPDKGYGTSLTGDPDDDDFWG